MRPTLSFDVVVSKECYSTCFNLSQKGDLNWRNSVVSLISASQHTCPVESCNSEVQLRHLLRHLNTHCFNNAQALIRYRCPLPECKYSSINDDCFTKLSHCVMHFCRIHYKELFSQSEPLSEAVAFYTSVSNSKIQCQSCLEYFKNEDSFRIHCSRSGHGLKHARNRKRSLPGKNDIRIAPKNKPNHTTPINPTFYIVLTDSSKQSKADPLTSSLADVSCQTEEITTEATTSTSPLRHQRDTDMITSNISSPEESEALLSPIFVEAETFTDPTAVHSTAAQTVRDGDKSPMADLAAMSVQTDALDSYYRWNAEFMSHAGTQTIQLTDEDELFMPSDFGSSAFQNAGTQTNHAFVMPVPQNERRPEMQLFSLWS